MCLNAQCFHSFTCLRIKSECVKGEGFLISYFFLLGGGEKVAERGLDGCCEVGHEVAWCGERGCRGRGTDGGR